MTVIVVISIVSVVTCRQEVYSCWSTASGARVNNYGARIDLILLAEPAIAGQADAAHDVDKPDVSSNIAFPVLASTQQQQSRYRSMLILSKPSIPLYLSFVCHGGHQAAIDWVQIHAHFVRHIYIFILVLLLCT